MDLSLLLPVICLTFTVVEGDVMVGDELACSCPAGSDAKTINHVVETALEEENEVLTLLAGHTGSLVVGVTELTLQHTVHVLHFLLLLQLSTILLLLLALSSQTMLSGRSVSLFEGLVGAIDRLAKLTGDSSGRTSISCHSSSSLKIKLYGGP